jgi:hypothetical protein
MLGIPIDAATSAHSALKARGEVSEPSSVGNRRSSSVSFPNYPLLHDVYFLAMREEPFGRAVWEWACSPLSDVMRESLNEKLANPDYQLADRLKVWGEIGKKPPGPIPGTATSREVANAP